jgi:hypothetical protein
MRRSRMGWIELKAGDTAYVNMKILYQSLAQ